MGAYGGNYGSNFAEFTNSIPPVTPIKPKTVRASLCVNTKTKSNLSVNTKSRGDLSI